MKAFSTWQKMLEGNSFKHKLPWTGSAGWRLWEIYNHKSSSGTMLPDASAIIFIKQLI